MAFFVVGAVVVAALFCTLFTAFRGYAARRDAVLAIEVRRWRGCLREAHREGYAPERKIAAENLQALIAQRHWLARWSGRTRRFYQ